MPTKQAGSIDFEEGAEYFLYSSDSFSSQLFFDSTQVVWVGISKSTSKYMIKLSNIYTEEVELRPELNVELQMRRAKLSELSSTELVELNLDGPIRLNKQFCCFFTPSNGSFCDSGTEKGIWGFSQSQNGIWKYFAGKLDMITLPPTPALHSPANLNLACPTPRSQGFSFSRFLDVKRRDPGNEVACPIEMLETWLMNFSLRRKILRALAVLERVRIIRLL